MTQVDILDTLEPPTRQWTISAYLWFLAALATVSLPFLLVGTVARRPMLGVLPLAIGVFGLTLVKPEGGVLLLLLLAPMEDVLSVIPGTLTVVRVLGVLVVLSFGVHAMMGKRVILNDPYVRRHGLLVLVMFVSILLSRYPLLGMINMQTQLAFLAFTVLALSLIEDDRMVDNAVVFLFLGCLTGAALGLAGEMTGHRSLTQERLTIGEGSNPNTFSRAIGPGLLLLPYMFWRFRATLVRAVIVACSLTIAAAVVKTQARGVWVSLALAVPASFWFATANLASRTIRTVGIVVAALVVLVIGLQVGLIGTDIVQRYQSIEQGVEAGGRAQIWRVCVAAFLEHPVFGMGMQIFGYDSMEVAFRHGLPLPKGVSRDPHSSYFAVLADLGLVGILASAAMLLNMLRGLIRLERTPLRGAAMGLFFFLLLSSISGTSLNRKYFWMPMAVMAAIIAVRRRTLSQSDLTGLEGDNAQAN